MSGIVLFCRSDTLGRGFVWEGIVLAFCFNGLIEHTSMYAADEPICWCWLGSHGRLGIAPDTLSKGVDGSDSDREYLSHATTPKVQIAKLCISLMQLF